MAIRHVFLFRALMGISAAIVLSGAYASAGTIFSDLPPGSTYQLIFLTHDTMQANSDNINDYNSFVTQEAAMSSALPADATWSVIGSTATVNARNNVSTSNDVPVYTPSGVLVADSSAALWQTAATPLLNQVIEDQYGSLWVMNAWTGTQADGTAASNSALGQWNSTPDSNHVTGPEMGCGVYQTSRWLDVQPYSNNQGTWTQALSLYALSSVITVPAIVPEPATLVLLACGMLGLLAYTWRRRKKAA